VITRIKLSCVREMISLSSLSLFNPTRGDKIWSKSKNHSTRSSSNLISFDFLKNQTDSIRFDMIRPKIKYINYHNPTNINLTWFLLKDQINPIWPAHTWIRPAPQSPPLYQAPKLSESRKVSAACIVGQEKLSDSGSRKNEWLWVKKS
jgi:hypothetical protein